MVLVPSLRERAAAGSHGTSRRPRQPVHRTFEDARIGDRVAIGSVRQERHFDGALGDGDPSIVDVTFPDSSSRATWSTIRAGLGFLLAEVTARPTRDVETNARDVQCPMAVADRLIDCLAMSASVDAVRLSV